MRQIWPSGLYIDKSLNTEDPSSVLFFIFTRYLYFFKLEWLLVYLRFLLPTKKYLLFNLLRNSTRFDIVTLLTHSSMIVNVFYFSYQVTLHTLKVFVSISNRIVKGNIMSWRLFSFVIEQVLTRRFWISRWVNSSNSITFRDTFPKRRSFSVRSDHWLVRTPLYSDPRTGLVQFSLHSKGVSTCDYII